jgi:type IV pilus assembly protein PilQ
MKKTIMYSLWLLAPFVLWAQATSNGSAASGPNTPSAANEVVEIPDALIEGVRRSDDTPSIPTDVQALPAETEIVLELPGEGTSQPGEATLASEETISVDFPDEDVRTILRNIADLFELNLVIPDTLQGRTSLKLRNITWQQAFQVVLEPLGFTYVEDRNIIMIKSIEDLTTEPVDTRVFVSNYARAEDLKGSIEPLIDSAAGGRVQVDVRSNALVITERPSRMGKIQEIIERLDRATDQVMIESKFIEVTNTDVKNLGINWASLSGYNASAGPFQRSETDTETDSFTETTRSVSNVPTNIEDILAAQQAELDNGPGSTVIPAPIFESPYSFTDTFSDVSETIDTALFSADEFEVILSALRTNNDVKLVSNPTVVTMNNTKAKIAIGERFPIPSYTFNAETGQRQLDEIEYEDIGITLDVTPQVNNAGFINLQIVPEVSSTDRFSLIENTQIPIIESRRTETSIVLKDGFTLAIGGLSENSTVDRGTKVPLLGDLPGVGRLFRSENDELTSRNLIIFITAKTLNPDGSTYKDIVDPRVLNEMGITPSEVPGFKISQEHREALNKIDEVREKALYTDEIEQLKSTIQSYEQAEIKRLEAAEKKAAASKAR